MGIGSHDGDLGARPGQRPCSYRMTFLRVCVEKVGRRPALEGRGEFPTEIHRVSYAGVEALSAEGRMNVCGIAGQQDATLAIGCRLTRAVRVGGSYLHRGESDVGAGDAAQNILQAFERGGLRAIEGSFVKFDHPDAVGAGTLRREPYYAPREGGATIRGVGELVDSG